MGAVFRRGGGFLACVSGLWKVSWGREVWTQPAQCWGINMMVVFLGLVNSLSSAESSGCAKVEL